MTAQSKQQAKLTFVGSFLGAMIPVASFAFWLGQVSARVDVLELEVLRLRDTKTATVEQNPYATINFKRYTRLPHITPIELPLY